LANRHVRAWASTTRLLLDARVIGAVPALSQPFVAEGNCSGRPPAGPGGWCTSSATSPAKAVLVQAWLVASHLGSGSARMGRCWAVRRRGVGGVCANAERGVLVHPALWHTTVTDSRASAAVGSRRAYRPPSTPIRRPGTANFPARSEDRKGGSLCLTEAGAETPRRVVAHPDCRRDAYC